MRLELSRALTDLQTFPGGAAGGAEASGGSNGFGGGDVAISLWAARRRGQLAFGHSTV